MIQYIENNLTEEIDEKIVYCLKVLAKRHDDLLFKIRELYNEIKNNGLHKKFNEIGMYGISFKNDDERIYYVGCEEQYEGTDKLVIIKNKERKVVKNDKTNNRNSFQALWCL